MSEKLYQLLWRLHHPQFRDAYRDDALQLFRDRLRAETGLTARLRLWLDLLADFAITVPRGYREAHFQLRTVSGHQDGPAFRTLESDAPSRGPLLIGGALALILLALLPTAFTQTTYRPHTRSLLDRVRLAYEHAAGEANTPNTFAQGIGASAAATAPTAPEPKWQHDVLQAVVANLREHYPDPVTAQKVAEALVAQENQGGYLTFTDQSAFAAQLTRQLRDISHDPHFDVVYSPTPLPDMSAEPNPDRLARYRQLMQDQHCTIEKAELLADRRTGYLKLNSFPDPAICRDAVTNALTSLNPATALIIDLRDNRGGSPAMVMYLAAYLFDHPEYLYNPRENVSLQSWTKSPVPGSQLAGKPLYLLTSSTTVSAAEHFAYNMKMLKRATLIGETTRGSAHAGVFHRLDDHFGIGIPEAKPLNPFSDHDWEGVGVPPDVPVDAGEALPTAKRLAAANRP